MMLTDNIKPGIYSHYKSDKLYRVIFIAKHTETLEEMVVYQSLYFCEKFGNRQLWIRPKKMFEGSVFYNGSYVPRFKRTESQT